MIVVDDIVEYPSSMTTERGLPGRFWCHMQSTDNQTPAGEAELRTLAMKLRCRESWIQKPGLPNRVHFDLTPKMRAKAVALGAVEVNLQEFTRARLSGPDSLASYIATCNLTGSGGV